MASETPVTPVNIAATLRSPRTLTIDTIPIPEPAEDEVLVKIESIGICTSDLLVYEGTHATNLPIVPGHESAGVVVKVGSEVSDIKVGDRVTPEASWTCGTCPKCKQSGSTICSTRIALGRSRDGTFASFISVPARAAYVLPDEITFDQGQALVTVACSMRAFSKGGMRAGERVAIFGPGISGIILAQLAMLNGASEAIVFGTRDWRLKLSRDLGASHVVNVRTSDWAEQARLLTDGQGFDIVLEASGSQEGIFQALEVVGTGGRVVTFSLYNGTIDAFPAQVFYGKEVSIIGTRGGAGQYPQAISLVKSGQLQINDLITDHLPLAQATEGFELAASRKEGVMRVVLTP